MVQIGAAPFTYDARNDWEQLPDGLRLHETAGIAVDAQDRVYLLTRNVDNPVVVLERDGTFLRTFGQGVFTPRAHAIRIGPDGFAYGADDGAHIITKWTVQGELVMTIGTPGQASGRFSGLPFNRPTDVAVSPIDGSLYISDGYGNARIHKYSAEGELLFSWGEPGIGAGQFMVPHNIAFNPSADLLYVADREAHRVQVFDTTGRHMTTWHDIHRPCGLAVGPDGNVYVGEQRVGNFMVDALNLGHAVSVFSPNGTQLARLGAPHEGEGAGEFIAPHSIAVDSRGSVYVGEVSYTECGRHLDPPRELKSVKKLARD
jgi:DNA-binding beta-propeller fold protein YncE